MTRSELNDYAGACPEPALAALCGAAAGYLEALSPEDRDDPRLWVWLVAFACRERGLERLWTGAIAAVRAERRSRDEANRRAGGHSGNVT